MSTELGQSGYPRSLPSHYHRCFGCGSDHPTGLHVTMEATDERTVRGAFVVGQHHQGAPGLAHGGIVAAAVDEAMGYLLWLVGSPAVTARLEIDYRSPVPVGARLDLEARVERIHGRRIHTSLTGWVDGAVAVASRALYVKVDVDHFVPHARRMGEEMGEQPYNP